MGSIGERCPPCASHPGAGGERARRRRRRRGQPSSRPPAVSLLQALQVARQFLLQQATGLSSPSSTEGKQPAVQVSPAPPSPPAREGLGCTPVPWESARADTRHLHLQGGRSPPGAHKGLNFPSTFRNLMYFILVGGLWSLLCAEVWEGVMRGQGWLTGGTKARWSPCAVVPWDSIWDWEAQGSPGSVLLR